MEEMQQHKVAQMIKSAEGSAGLLHKISKPTAGWRGVQILVNEEEDARLLHRCEAKRKERAKHWQCDEEGAERGGNALEERGIEKCRGSTAKAEGVSLGRSVEIVLSKDRSRV